MRSLADFGPIFCSLKLNSSRNWGQVQWKPSGLGSGSQRWHWLGHQNWVLRYISNWKPCRIFKNFQKVQVVAFIVVVMQCIDNWWHMILFYHLLSNTCDVLWEAYWDGLTQFACRCMHACLQWSLLLKSISASLIHIYNLCWSWVSFGPFLQVGRAIFYFSDN